MCLPDQNHIDQVRDALWRHGASVMVGAGFSRNAISSVPNPNSLPILDNLEEAFFKELYPRQEYHNYGNAPQNLTNASNFPRLSREYELTFGRGRLNQLLQDLIRDDQFRPTEMHKRLLSLPWRDVFTTNWDTLLERSLTSVPERKYSILRNKDEIPLSSQPRIVKLHGSFPAHFPLICTEEDYRTYPVKFASFVNTMQQAMMETVFLLIGFSGDDPNFIHWTGWVRDNLGESALKIYLAGWLDLSSHRRRVLEHRNVVAIDLARHPKADQWPEHQRHEYATEWILHTLEYGERYMPTEWPSPRKWRYLDGSVPNALLQPVVKINTDKPKGEPHPGENPGSRDLRDRIDEIIQIWAHNRSLYPGWLVVPVSVRTGISRNTDDWEEKILGKLSEFDPVQQLRMIYELIWRREILLDPLSYKLESAAQDVLQRIDCQNRAIGNVVEPRTEIEWSDVRQNYRNVLLALLTNTRLRFCSETFEKRLKELDDFKNDHLDVAHRIYHERCLWAIYSLDYKSLQDLLTEWSLEGCDPIWMVRKATLLYEINRVNEANELTAQALEAIRNIPDSTSSVAGPSREGWALNLAAVIESTISFMRFRRSDPNMIEFPADPKKFYNRWRELAPMKCDTGSEIHEYKNALASTIKSDTGASFDLGREVIPGIQFSNIEEERLRAPYRTIRLSEVAALPTFGFGTLKSVAEKISVSDPEMATRLILRTLSDDGDNSIKQILSRTHVALMPVELARKLARICDSVIKYSLPRIGVVDTSGYGSFWTERMRVSMEVLSRLVVRLDPEEVEEVFNNSLLAYNNTYIAQAPWFYQSLRNMLSRSWLSLPKQHQVARILDLLSAPIIRVGNTLHSHLLYPDPSELLQKQLLPPERTNDNERSWQQIVSQLARGLNEGGNIRKRSSLWVSHIVSWNRLTEEEIDKVAQALWNETFMEPTGLPKETSLFEWGFMVLPEPEPGLAEKRFRDRYLSNRENVIENKGELSETLDQVGKAISGLKSYGKSLTLSKTEKEFVIDILRQWAEAPLPKPKNPEPFISRHSVDQFIESEIKGVSAILTDVQIPTDLAERLYEKMEGLSDLKFSVFGFIPGLSMVLKGRFNEFTDTMKLGLVSQNKDQARAALRTLSHWLSLTVEPVSHIQIPPDELVREVGVIIASRRRETLRLALQVAKWIFDKGTDAHKQIIQNMTLRGLKDLLEDFRYDGENFGQIDDLPDLRNHSVQLALSMSENGVKDNDTINQWLQDAENDPLPELRYARDSV